MASTETAPVRAQSLSTLIESLNSCLTGAISSLPVPHKDAPTDVSIAPPQDGISLLDTKSEILLSYLQNLVFLIIFQLREKQSGESENAANGTLRDEVVNKLVELRVFLDRGVRPLEGRLKYQIDKVIKAAEDSDRTERPAKSKKPKKASRVVGSDSDVDSEDEDEASDSEEDSGEEDEEDMDEMAYRPNVAALAKGKVEQKLPQAKAAARQEPSDGIYRPPKIMPTALPTTERRERQDRRPRRSNVIDEFVSAEMSAAPMAEPSIGSTIIDGGRQTKSKKDREHEAERTRYEETNFVRLPKETKKDLAKRGVGRRDGTYGGDEWKGLNEGADHIERLTRRSKNSGSALEKSRKRKNEDGQRSDGVAVGDIFDKRRKKIDTWKR
ncbi:hypothetical protein F1880_004538 [Penicillium rolfsii]|nr:hypothetical protein F1880_004538 [Penicillium rolfsii]